MTKVSFFHSNNCHCTAKIIPEVYIVSLFSVGFSRCFQNFSSTPRTPSTPRASSLSILAWFLLNASFLILFGGQEGEQHRCNTYKSHIMNCFSVTKTLYSFKVIKGEFSKLNNVLLLRVNLVKHYCSILLFLKKVLNKILFNPVSNNIAISSFFALYL